MQKSNQFSNDCNFCYTTLIADKRKLLWKLWSYIVSGLRKFLLIDFRHIASASEGRVFYQGKLHVK